jgi:hypothetical protein
MNTKYFFIFCSVTALLLGCSTPGQMRQHVPDLELKSNRPAKDVAVCIADKWENGSALSFFGGTYPISMRMTNDGYIVSITTYPTLFVDVNDAPNGSLIKFFRDSVSPGFESDVKKCAVVQ